MIRVETTSKELQAYLQRVEAKVDTTLTRTLRRAALMVEAQAKRNAPVNFGVLRNSITNEVVEVSPHRYEAHVGTTMKYAGWQEFGTRSHWAPVRTKSGELTALGLWLKRKLKISDEELRKRKPYMWIKGTAHPFLVPALDSKREAIRDLFMRSLGESFGGAA